MPDPALNTKIVHRVSPEVQRYLDQFIDFFHKVELRPDFIERPVYGDGYAGTPDFVGYMNLWPGELVLCDWKSGRVDKRGNVEQALQVVAYGDADEVDDGIFRVMPKVERFCVLDLKPDRWRLLELRDPDVFRAHWRDLLRLYRRDVSKAFETVMEGEA